MTNDKEIRFWRVFQPQQGKCFQLADGTKYVGMADGSIRRLNKRSNKHERRLAARV